MRTCKRPEIRKVLGTPLLAHAQKLAQSNRVYRIRDLDGGFAAQVLSDFQPEEVELYPATDRLDYRCSCGDQRPCAHVLALLVALDTRSDLPTWISQDLSRGSRPQAQEGLRRGQALDRDLFDEGLAQPSLFELEPRRPERIVEPNLEVEPETVGQPASATWGRAEAFPGRPAPVGSQLNPADFELVNLEPRAVLHLAERLDQTEIRLFFAYEGVEINWNSGESLVRLAHRGPKIAARRDREAEQGIRASFMTRIETWLRWERGMYADLVLSTTVSEWGLNAPLARFLTDLGSDLVAEGWELRLAGQKVLGRAALKVRLDQSADWFDIRAGVLLGETLEFAIDAESRHGAVATAQGYVILTQADLRRLAFLRTYGMDDSGLVAASPINLSLVDALYEQLEDQDHPLVAAGRSALAELRDLVQAAHSGPALPPEIALPAEPPGLAAQLRPYQRLGFAWLSALHRHGFGGILADDMGLGKTIQTLALLEDLRGRGELGPSLLVAPVVTLANWQAEIERFAPQLKLWRHQGVRRNQDLAALRSGDLVLVSYQTLRNDLDIFAAHEWDYLILDEAHYIKNAASQVFKAIRVLTARHRLSLTGTPLENNAMELWSQFSFLNPGLLGTSHQFYETFAQPIERQQDETSAQLLRGLIGPFILRRRKAEVLTDLPAKEESVHWVEMEGRQAELYEAHRRTYQEQILGLLDEQGLAQSRLQILRCLLRLRQLAIAPVLADPEDAAVPSAKFEALYCMLEELIAEGNKVLVFSQFTKTLDILGAEFARRAWGTSLLTGQTKDRQAAIDRFQNEANCPIFLLSLKAGGVGINLTKANYVILLDPWWNPAAENQAIDRAYRIGQTQVVTAYKMITRGSIEEKILALQARKTQLQTALISPEGGGLGQLSEDDVKSLFLA